MKEKRIVVFGCKHTTRDLILGLLRNNIPVRHVVTISPNKGEEQQVAGYYDLREFLDGLGIPYYSASKYSLTSDKDREALLALRIDLALVTGWQRLLPDWLLESMSIGAFGMHGSSKPLPHGRGRSPMNWSLIQGKDVFYTHLFKYNPGTDDGPVVGMQTFDISPHDDCHTLHFKNLAAMIQLCRDNVPSLLDGSAILTPQPTAGATYYPKRSAEDGLVFFDDPTSAVYNLIRAVTRPFPGAFAFLDNSPASKIMLWRAIPFDTKITWPSARPGEIVQVFYDGSFVVQTGDASLLVQEYEGHKFSDSDTGRLLGCAGFERKVWDDLPE